MFVDVLQEAGVYEAEIKGISLIFEMLVVILFIACYFIIFKIEKLCDKLRLLKNFLKVIAFVSGLVFVLWLIQFITHIHFWDLLVKYINNIFY